MKKHLSKLLLACILISGFASAQAPTWASDIAPILYNNCTTCHHPGGLAPNSLMTYQQAFNNRNLIQQYVANKYMPPWPPDAEYKHLAFERLLSTADKNKIFDWVAANGPQGNINVAPTPPTYTNNSTQLTQINFSAKMTDYTVNTASDLYRCFVINTNFTSDKFATAIEVRPGNSSIVHHVLVFEDTAQAIVNLDNADPGPGYTSFFSTGSNSSRLVGEWVPGTAPIKFPTNMGVRLRKNTRIIMQIHYPKGTFLQLDSTRVNITLATNTVFPFREVVLAPVISENDIINGPLTIPANTTKSFTASAIASIPAGSPHTPLHAFTLLSIAPHMHLIGQKIKVFAIDSISNDTVPLINIPKWDFKWQGVYNFRNPIKIPEGSTLVCQSYYDNTSANISNPNTPPITVNWGEATDDEMMLVFAALTYYMPGDESIIVDNSPIIGIQEFGNKDIAKTVQLYNVFPNPAKSTAKLSYYAPDKMAAKAKIINMEGKIIKEWPLTLQEGFGDVNLNIEGLSKGQYFVHLETKSYTKTKTFIVYE